MKPWMYASLLAAFGIAAMALAKPAFVKEFQSTYGVKSTTPLGQAKCTACHIGKATKLNPYGKDLQAAMVKEGAKTLTGSVLKKVEGLDSDKDGKSNLTEIRAGTLPGDDKSK